jgi:hypothetical protein
MDWPGTHEIAKLPFKNMTINGKEVAAIKNYRNFSFAWASQKLSLPFGGWYVLLTGGCIKPDTKWWVQGCQSCYSDYWPDIFSLRTSLKQRSRSSSRWSRWSRFIRFESNQVYHRNVSDEMKCCWRGIISAVAERPSWNRHALQCDRFQTKNNPAAPNKHPAYQRASSLCSTTGNIIRLIWSLQLLIERDFLRGDDVWLKADISQWLPE